MRRYLPILLLLPAFAVCQQVVVHDAPRAAMPGTVDSNSPAFWRDGTFHLINSTGMGPLLSSGPDQFGLGNSQMASIRRARRDWPTWIEAVWVDPGGLVFAWYHQEQEYVCAGLQRPNMPRIGAAVSYDGGRNFSDLGIVLSSGDPADCSARNGYFAGGHGDFSVVLDREEQFFYFLFSSYGGSAASQGIVTARMAYVDRFRPANRVWKYHEGGWTQSGVGGAVSPIFPVTVRWQVENTDAFWGPSVHWNTHLQTFVALMNRSCCSPGWPQEGIYVSFNSNPGNPGGWSRPAKILDGVFWYPQVLGLGAGETDSLAGERARLYVFGESKWELEFVRPDEMVEVPLPEPEPEPDPEPEPAPEPEPGSELQPEPETPPETGDPATPPEGEASLMRSRLRPF